VILHVNWIPKYSVGLFSCNYYFWVFVFWKNSFGPILEIFSIKLLYAACGYLFSKINKSFFRQ
jgi:hypothetical protein